MDSLDKSELNILESIQLKSFGIDENTVINIKGLRDGTTQSVESMNMSPKSSDGQDDLEVVISSSVEDDGKQVFASKTPLNIWN